MNDYKTTNSSLTIYCDDKRLSMHNAAVTLQQNSETVVINLTGQWKPRGNRIRLLATEIFLRPEHVCFTWTVCVEQI